MSEQAKPQDKQSKSVHLDPEAKSEGLTGRIFNFSSARNDKLERRKNELEANLNDLIRAGMRTDLNLRRVERSVLRLVSASDLESLLNIYAFELADLMAVDSISLCLEASGGRLTSLKFPHIYWLTPGSLEVTMHDAPLILSGTGDDYVRVFGNEADKIRSCALVHLRMPDIGTQGVLAFGSHTEGFFDASQGSDFIAFMGQLSERLLSRSFLDERHLPVMDEGLTESPNSAQQIVSPTPAIEETAHKTPSHLSLATHNPEQ